MPVWLGNLLVCLSHLPFSLLSDPQYFLSPEDAGFAIDSSGTISTAAAFDFESGTRR